MLLILVFFPWVSLPWTSFHDVLYHHPYLPGNTSRLDIRLEAAVLTIRMDRKGRLRMDGNLPALKAAHSLLLYAL